MILFDVFAEHVNCPACGEVGARRLLWIVRCRNLACRHFDRETVQQTPLVASRMPPTAAPLQASPRAVAQPFDFTAFFKGNINIRYRNFRGVEKSFHGDAATARRRGNHISLCVEPTGRRIALSRERITNLSEVEARLPNANEKRILGYHHRSKTSSPRHQEVLRKYPHLA